MEDTNEAKQTLLREEIVEKEYDQQKFVDFCLSKKENGDDLEQWTLDQLKDLIKEFQQANLSDRKISMDTEEEIDKERLEEQKKEEQKQLEIKRDIDKITSVKQAAPKQGKSEALIEVKCKTLEKSVLNDKEVKVVIQNPKKVEKSILSSDYVKYEVVTQSSEGWQVARRYSDFIWLRGVLVKYNPGQVVPPIPSKQLGGKRFEEEFIIKRMSFLQRFMDDVMKNEYFKACEPLIVFLSVGDRGIFESKMKSLDSFKPSPFVEDFKTFTGTVKIAKEIVDNEKYFTNIANYFNIQDILFDRLSHHMKKVNHDISEACRHLEMVQKDFETFHTLNDRVLMKAEVTKSYEQIGIFVKNYRRILLNQNEMFKIHFKDFFKFIQMEGTSYEELIKNREHVKNKYQEVKHKLLSKKEKLWNNGDTAKWEIEDDFNKVNAEQLKSDKSYAFAHMCTKDTKKCDSMQKQFGYVNKMNFEELRKMIDHNCERFIGNLTKFSEVFYPSLTDFLNIFSGMQVFIATSTANLASNKK